MPAFPNASKVANKAAAFQMLLAVALECEYFNYCVDLTVEEISFGQVVETLTRAEWLNDYTHEDEAIEFCQCDDCEGLTVHNEEHLQAQHDYYHASL